MHINCLELLAATLAAKTFLKGQIGQSVLLQLDNQTAVAYINNMGGTVSPQLTDLAKALWMWALSNDIALIAEYIPGVANVVADAESRSMTDRADWKLHPRLLQGINQKKGPLEVDLFASRLSTQLPCYFSWKPDPLAEATDAFTQQWEKFRGYANPSWCLIGIVLSQVQRQQTQVILVAPVWKGQPWYPILLEMLYDYPQQLPRTLNLFQRTSNVNQMDILPQLAVWPVSGKNSDVEVFQRQLRSSSLHPGGAKHPEPMTHTSGKWLGWCTERGRDPISGPISDVVNFLADSHMQGYQTNFLYRSAISTVHDRVDDVDVGKHPLVARVLKGAYHARPSLPRYTTTWDVQVVVDGISKWGDTTSMSLKLLTYKLVMLMALTRPSRSADLTALSVSKCQFKPEGVSFLPSGLAKQSRQGKPLAGFLSSRQRALFSRDSPSLYVCNISPEEGIRPAVCGIIKPHKPVVPCTIARWLKEMLKLSGVDVNMFTAHSTRSASVTAAADSGVTTNDILKAADWSTESVFRKFYYHPTHDPLYGRAVLSSATKDS